MLKYRAHTILEYYRRILSDESGVPIYFVDTPCSDLEQPYVGAGTSSFDERLNIQGIFIGVGGLDDGLFFAKDEDVCNVLITMGHEIEHVNQAESIRNGDASSELLYSWISGDISEHYYDLNYNLCFKEISAERAGVDFALDVLTDEFNESKALAIMTKRMENVQRLSSDEYNEFFVGEYMLAQVDENFAQSKDWDVLFKKLIEKSKTAERSYSPYVYENHYVDDLERFYTKSEENKEFIDRAVKRGDADKFICAAGICENTGHYSRNADWLPEGRSMLVNMKTDMLGYLWSVDPTLKPPPETEQSREAVDMSTVDVDDSLDLIETNEPEL